MASVLSSTKVAGGTLRRVKHASAATTTDMTFAIFTPAATVEPEGGWPVIYWLSGLTSSPEGYAFESRVGHWNLLWVTSPTVHPQARLPQRRSSRRSACNGRLIKLLTPYSSRVVGSRLGARLASDSATFFGPPVL